MSLTTPICMKKIKLFIFLISFGLLSSVTFSEEGEEEAAQPSNPQELLEIVKQGQFADTQEQRDRESEFRNEKNKQAKLLSDAKDERARLEREAARLEQQFEANEALLVVAEEQLRERLGSLNEIFGHLAGNTTEARNIMEQSITAAQFGKEREEFMTALGSKMNEGIKLASIQELETLWYELQREINASGEVVKFNTEVITTDGNVENRDVVRVGNFNVVSDGQYLTYSPTRGAYSELGSQPAGRYTAQSSDILNGDTFPVQFAVDPTGPQGGSLLASLISMPSTWGKMQEGGFVGTVLMIILLKLVTTADARRKMKKRRRATSRRAAPRRAPRPPALAAKHPAPRRRRGIARVRGSPRSIPISLSIPSSAVKHRKTLADKSDGQGDLFTQTSSS